MPAWFIAVLFISAIGVGVIAGIVFTFYFLRHLLWKIIDVLTDRD